MQMTNIQSRILQHWKSVATEKNGLPARKDFRLQDLGQNALDIVVLDVTNGPSQPIDFTYRLIGSNVAENLSENYTGKSLSDLPGKGPKSQIWANMKDACDKKQPVFREVPYVGPDDSEHKLNTLYLPLANDHQKPDKILIVPNYPPKRKTGLFAPTPKMGDQGTSSFS